jgi:hypothetical protein
MTLEKHSLSPTRNIRKAVSKFYSHRISVTVATSVVLDCKPSHLSSSTTDCADRQEHRRNVLQSLSTELCPHDVPAKQSPSSVHKHQYALLMLFIRMKAKQYIASENL